MFKIIKGFDNVDYKVFFKSSDDILRDHLLKLFKCGCRLNCRKCAFSFRSVDLRKSLDILLHVTQLTYLRIDLPNFLKGRGFM